MITSNICTKFVLRSDSLRAEWSKTARPKIHNVTIPFAPPKRRQGRIGSPSQVAASPILWEQL